MKTVEMNYASAPEPGDYVIVSDFDGTITFQDSNHLLFKMCGNAQNEQIERDYLAGRLDDRRAMQWHFETMKVSAAAFYSFLDRHINVDRSFYDCIEQAHARGIAFFIVSGGFRQTIEHLLDMKRLPGVIIYANDLREDRPGQVLKPSFARLNPACDIKTGPCSNCKRVCLQEIRQRTNKKILYIGDGLTDRCAVHEADRIFAKAELADYCRENRLPYTPFKDFADLSQTLWG